MKYTVLAFITLWFLASCQQKQAENNHTTDSAKTVITDTELSEEEFYQEYFVKVPVTNFNPFVKPSITIANPENTEQLLAQLFPGKLCPPAVSGVNVPVVLWKTSSRKTKKMKTFFDDDNDDFPVRGGMANETRFEDSFYYQINNTRYFAFFFSSTGFDGTIGLMRTGRFNCATFGVAVFKSTGAGWQLDVFNPAIGCFGMFGTPNHPHKIQLGKQQYGFFITNGVAGGGAPYEANAFFYNFTEGVPQIFSVNSVVRNNTALSLWGFDVETTEIEGQAQYEVKVNIEGFINDYSPEIEDVSGWPNQYKELAEKHGNYKFTHHQTFVPDANGRYTFNKETFEHEAWPLDSIKGNAPNIGTGVYNQ